LVAPKKGHEQTNSKARYYRQDSLDSVISIRSIEDDYDELTDLLESTTSTLTRRTSQHFDKATDGLASTHAYSICVRVLSLMIDLGVICLFYFTGLVVAFAYGLCENDFLYYAYTVPSKEVVGSLKTFLQYFVDDISESAFLCSIISAEILLVFGLRQLAYKGQTLGMSICGLSYTSLSDLKSNNSNNNNNAKTRLPAEMSFLGIMFRTCIQLLCLPALPFVVDLGDWICGYAIVRTNTCSPTPFPKALLVPARRASSSSSSSSSTSGRTVEAIESKVNRPFHERPWNDLFFLFLFVLSTGGFYIAQRLFMANHPVSAGAYKVVSPWVEWLISTMFGGVDQWAPTHVEATLLLMATSLLVFFVVLLLLRVVAVLVLWAGIAFFFWFFGSNLYVALEHNDSVHIGTAISMFLCYTIYIWRVYRQLKFTVELWREAVLVSTQHPVLALSVQFIEFGFQVYQLWLLSTIFGLWVSESDESVLLQRFGWFLQLFVVFTLRSAFEIAIAGTVGKYYFRPRNGSADGLSYGVSRSLSSLASAFTLSFGSAAFAGLLLYFAEVVKWVYDKVQWAYFWTSWVLLPLKILLWLVKKALAILYNWLQNFVLFSCAYCGLLGISFYEGGEKTIALMKHDLVLTLTVGDYSVAIMFILANVCCNVMYRIIPHVLNLAADFLKDPSLSNQANNVPAYVVCAYTMISVLWSLSGATRTILLCVAEEVSRGVPISKMRASTDLQSAIQAYRNRA